VIGRAGLSAPPRIAAGDEQRVHGLVWPPDTYLSRNGTKCRGSCDEDGKLAAQTSKPEYNSLQRLARLLMVRLQSWGPNMKTAFFSAAALAAVTATGASAQTYDAFATFNGTQGAGNFYYGEADPANPSMSGTFFSATTNCFIAGSTCLQRAPNFDVPGFTKSTVPSFQYGSVNVPTDRLLAHPGNDMLQTFVAFVAPTAGTYNYTATFNIQDVNPSGVGINFIQTTNGGLPLIFSPLAVIDRVNNTYTTSGTIVLGQSYAFGFGLDNNGFYGNDSTGVNFTVSAASGVPEPAAWALLITGFGVVGGAMRRRTRTTGAMVRAVA